MNRRVLFIAYIFPPAGGAGVQRAVKFIKYLPHYGWLPSVLTVANPSVPLLDSTLGTDIPPNTIIRRARTLEPRYGFKAAVTADTPPNQAGAARLRQRIKGAIVRLSKLILQPDVQVLWRPFAIQEGQRLLRQIPHAAIVATAPPYSTFLVGAALSRWSGLPLVLDYRDEWDLSSTYMENQRPDPLSRAIQRRMQHGVVRAARALVATTPGSAQALHRVCQKAHSKADVTWISNGFDPEDFPAEFGPPPAQGPYRLIYVGTIWALTSPVPLVEAVRLLAQRQPATAANLELVFAGRRLGPEGKALEALKDLPCRLMEHPYVDHAEAVSLLRSAHGLCALLSDLPGAGRVVPAKIFEYMAAMRPILAIGPPGELWELCRQCPAAHCFAPRNLEGIANWLAQEITNHSLGKTLNVQPWNEALFNRRQQAGQLAQLLDSLQQSDGRELLRKWC
jgi:glycosyltransferase involved in cell wall biosynthesis